MEQEAYEVDVCHDGRDGLDLFLQDAHDIVLLDRMLPTMNGHMDLLARHWRPRAPLRALGVCVSALCLAKRDIQLSFLPEEAAHQRRMALDRMVDDIRARYGHDAIRRGPGA